MKIEVSSIPSEGLVLQEEVEPGAFDLETETVKFAGPIKIIAEIYKITNTVTVSLELKSFLSLSCSRCLAEFETGLQKRLRFSYPIDKNQRSIDLGPDIRQEIILDYPIKPLCKIDCQGLCPECGKNLNEGGCHCGSTKKKTF